MEVTQVKQTGKGITVRWTLPNGNHTSKTELEDCPDNPSDEFRAAMKAVEGSLVRRCSIKGVSFAGAFRFTGISMSRDSAGHRQFKPSGSLEYGWGESGQSLPLLREKVDSETGKSILSDIELKQIETLQHEAAKYASGGREQEEMFEDDEDEAADG